MKEEDAKTLMADLTKKTAKGATSPSLPLPSVSFPVRPQLTVSRQMLLSIPPSSLANPRAPVRVSGVQLVSKSPRMRRPSDTSATRCPLRTSRSAGRLSPTASSGSGL